MLYGNWAIIKLAFGFLEKHDETWLIKMRFASLYLREISLGPSSESDQEVHGHAEVKC